MPLYTRGAPMPDPSRLTATDATARIRAGTLAPVALAEAWLAPIADREPTIHAFACLDAKDVRRTAEAAVRNPGNGALRGLPIAVKDVIDVGGMPTEQGS